MATAHRGLQGKPYADRNLGQSKQRIGSPGVLLACEVSRRGGRLDLLTQSITDLVGEPRIGDKADGQQHARVYLGQVGTTLLRNDKGAYVDLIASIYGLSGAEARIIRQAVPGRGLLIAGDERAMVQVVAPDALMPLITTIPGDG